jgi:hypothetical protein
MLNLIEVLYAKKEEEEIRQMIIFIKLTGIVLTSVGCFESPNVIQKRKQIDEHRKINDLLRYKNRNRPIELHIT